jgi:Inorganic Pyrophosphatase/Phage portal protein
VNIFNLFNRNKQKSSERSEPVLSRPLSVNSLFNSNYISVADYRFDPARILVSSRDEVVSRCIQLIINSVTSGGYKIKASENDIALIEKLLTFLDYEAKTKFVLNSILGSGGDCFAYFAKVEDQNIFNIESSFWQGQRRIEYTINPSTKKIEDLNIKNGYFFTIDTIRYDNCITCSAVNLSNDFLGLTPLMLVSEQIIEKQTINIANRELATKSGKLDGIFSPNLDFLKNATGRERLESMTQIETAIDMLSQSSNSLKNYAVVNLPLVYQRIQSSPAEMQYKERIEQINYAICAAFGVPPSLVQFSTNTDPNLSNAEQYRDNFAELNTNSYKTKLENFWTEVISRVLPNVEFKFLVAREETDESIALRDQFRQSIEDCLKLRELGINASPSIEGLEKLGIMINDQVSDNMTIVDAIETSTKSMIIEKDAKKLKKYVEWNNLKIGIQYSIGDLRHNKKMSCMYGYITNHKGEDKMALDVYIGPDLSTKMIFKIKQLDDQKEFDEWKFMIGFLTKEEAKNAYLKQIPNKYFGDIYYSSREEIARYKVKENVEPDFSLAEKASKSPPPNVGKLLESKEFKKFKLAIKSELKKQIDSLFTSKTKLSRYSDDRFYQEVVSSIPKFGLNEINVFELLKTTIIPNLLDQYNEYYSSNFTVNDLPKSVLDTLSDISKLTIQGNVDYGGINETTATALTQSVAKILGKQDLTLDQYSNLPQNQKKIVWTELKNSGGNLILTTRTDLLSEMLANNSFQSAYAELAKSESKGFVGVRTSRDARVRADHKLNEGKYFDVNDRQPWLDPLCRCQYIFDTEENLKKDGFTK